MTRPIALTCGEPAGIGPDLCIATALEARHLPLVCIADRGLLEQRATQLGARLSLQDYTPGVPVTHAAGELCVLHLPLAAPGIAGRLDARNARAVLAWIERAAHGCLANEFGAMVTAPVHKSIINDAGIPFTGHTEFIATLTGTNLPVMMLVGGDLRVALATTHLALRAVSAAITRDSLFNVLRILDHDLRTRFGIVAPRIAVCGLNPHAGENGHLGDEEIVTIAPALDAARAAGIRAHGPLPADTLFVPRNVAGYDAVLAMYHDQGLPVLKYAGFGNAVNVTLGLPIVRTSVDHGTALDLAGTGQADAGSLAAAIALAARLATTPIAAPAATAH